MITMRFRGIVLLTLNIALAICSPVQGLGAASLEHPRDKVTSGSLDACGSITQSLAVLTSSDAPLINPATAWECLKSTPFDTVKAKAFIEEIKKYVASQSTLAYLKNPPKGYLMPAVDILGEIEKVKETIYNSHYDFDVDIYKVMNAAYDGHFKIQLCSLKRISFIRPGLALVSYSKDLDALPRLYLQDDINGIHEPSPVKFLDGERAETYIEKSSLLSGSFHDPDALYNSMLGSIQTAALEGGATLFNYYLPGEFGYSTNVTFDNGTTKTYETIAVVNQADLWKSIRNAADFMETFCINSTRFENVTSTTSEPELSAPTEPDAPLPTQVIGYPEPVLPFYSVGNFAGYFLNAFGWEDVAVLSVRSFETGNDLILNQYTNYISQFLALSTAQGKKRLIIDLSGNGGGTAILNPTLFSRLFPQLQIVSYTNRRATKLFKLLGTIASSPLYSITDLQNYASGCNYHQHVKPDQSRFRSFEEYFGAEESHNDTFTSGIASFDFAKDIPGYLSNTTQPFAAENIVLLSDGQCSSACANFYELMTTFAGVKNIVVGGRPEYKPMQFVGGTKGGTVHSYREHFDTFLEEARYLVNSFGIRIDGIEGANELLSGKGGPVVPLETEKLPFQLDAGGGGTINMYNRLRIDPKNGGKQGDIPLQFWYEKADCRIFYTKETVLDVEKHWARVAETIWGNGTCVNGAA